MQRFIDDHANKEREIDVGVSIYLGWDYFDKQFAL